ncbi:carotenoid cleavage dioxygenase [Variovorax ginsengisoli]|uniref:Carotenoid cleavage dioxygenase n=1 Tax=Variovorax ginsengisoli TaxID=363844 RepID=A0ABT9SBU2_9BURK|nr:carotenoid oxygenase family protein [Variovorax ginsengisoli]MDP9900832.1 carotenoid cleavage dioxygenase [Variovorax ginsengisoli]
MRRLAAAGSALVLPSLSARANDDENWQAQFEASTTPWKSAFATVAGDIPLTAATVRGRFPDAVAGTLYRIGPAGHDLGGQRYHHWFDGDGMAHRFVIEGNEVHHQGRYVATAKRVAEVRAGRLLVEGFGTMFPGTEPVSAPDSMNVANINVLLIGGDLLALWEGGSATRMDPRTLETRGLKTWRADLAGVPFSAHPRIDIDGTVWNFGVSSSSGLLVLYEIAPDGTLRRADALPVSELPMIHDFAVTPRHLVFLMPPLVYDVQRKAAGMSFLDAHVWRPELGMRALVIDKKDWTRRRMLALPSGFLFHLGNAWEEETASGTVVHVDYVRSPDASSVFTRTREVMRARLLRGPGPRLTVASLNLGTGKATQVELPVEAEFPRMDPRLVGLRHRQVVHAAQLRDGLPLWGAIARTDVESGATQRFSYGSQTLVEEHLFVPDGNGPGWVLGTALDAGQRKTVLSCFAADALADGPVAQATLPYALPLGLHGNFVAA